MPRGVKKENLPAKICIVCDRPYTWRKKWERSWDEITTCSKSCNRRRRRAGGRPVAAGRDECDDDVDDDDDGGGAVAGRGGGGGGGGRASATASTSTARIGTSAAIGIADSIRWAT